MGSVRALATAALILAATFGATAHSVAAQAAPAAGAAATWAEWWNPAWHMRIPVTVSPLVADPLNESGGSQNFTAEGLWDYPVQVSLDFTQAMLEAGWPSANDQITSFTFDLDSIRVVEYTRLDAAGKPLTGKDVPYTFIPTRLDHEVPEAFNASSRAVGTVTWLAEGVTKGPRHYFVYFDTLENGKKAPRAFTVEESAALSALGWIGRGHHLAGYALEPLGDSKNTLYVHAIHDNTTVNVLTYPFPGTPPKEEASCSNRTLFLASGQNVLSCQLSGPLVFRVEASKPVSGFVVGPGLASESRNVMLPLAPSSGAGRGTDFRFTAVGDSPVLIVSSTPGPSAGLVLLDGVTGRRDTRTLAYSGTQEFTLVPGNTYTLTSTRNVTAHLRGNGFSHFPGVTGAPQDTRVSFTMDRQLAVTARSPGTLTLYDHTGSTTLTDQRYPDTGLAGYVYRTPSGLRTLFAEATTPAAFVAGDGADRAVVTVGGDNGRRFDLVVPDGAQGILVPFYENTAFTRTRLTETGASASSGTLNLDTFRADGEFMPAGQWRLDVSRPAAVFIAKNGNGPYAAALPARLNPMESEAGPAEFWGHSVSLKPRDLYVFVKPGDPAIFSFEVVNTGRSVTGESITDNFTIERTFLDSTLAGTWDALLSDLSVKNVKSGERALVTLEVSPRGTPRIGDLVEVRVAARSEGNPRLESSFVASAKVIILYDFRMTFADGKTESIQALKNGTSALYPIQLVNIGTGDDAVTFELDVPPFAEAQGWSWGLYERVNGTTPEGPVERLELPLGSPQNLTLVVNAPTGSAIPLDLTVRARSVNDTSKRHEIVARAAVDVNVDISLTVPEGELGVLPGGFVRFPVNVSNSGAPATVQVRLEGNASGFNATLEIPFSDGRPPMMARETSFLLEGKGSAVSRSSRTFFLNVTAVQGLLAGERVTFRILAVANAAGGSVQAERDLDLTAFVLNDHALSASTDVKTIAPGQPVVVPLRIVNNGNGEETVRLSPLSTPAGWTVTVPATPPQYVLARGADAIVPLTLTAPATAPPGAARVVLTARFADGTATNVSLDLALVEVRDLEAVANMTGVEITPGATIAIPVDVTNRGNKLQAFPLAAQMPAGWTVSLGTTDLLLDPGATTRLALTVTAPRDAPTGLHRVNLTVGGASIGAIDLRLGTLDLQLVKVEAPQGDPEPGSSVTYYAHVANVGDVTARGVLVALVVDGVRVSEARVEVIPANDTRIVPLPWTVTEGARDLVVVVDPDGRYSEAERGNNENRVQQDAGDSFVPGAEIVTFIAALAVCAAVMQRRRRA